VSSTYHPICLSHDPGNVLGQELTSREVPGFTRADVPGHANCDIVIGRWSGGLCELACLGKQIDGPTACKTRHHRDAQWIDSDWLRLLAAATTPPNVIDDKVLWPIVARCWPLERVGRLWEELGLPELIATPALPRCLSRSFGDQGWPCTLHGGHGGEHRSVQPSGTDYWHDRPPATED
jgi:hypothetical protein